MKFIAQWAFYSFLFCNRCNARFVIGFPYSLMTQMAVWSQTSTFLLVYVYRGLHKVLTLPVTVLLAKKQFCNVPLMAYMHRFARHIELYSLSGTSLVLCQIHVHPSQSVQLYACIHLFYYEQIPVSFWFYPHTDVCEHCILGTFPESYEEKNTGILLGWE